jgi:hypothetical protein
MITTIKTLSALSIAAVTLTAASLLASSNASAQVHDRTTISGVRGISPGVHNGRPSAVDGVARVPVKGECRGSCIPWQDSIWHPSR